MRVLVVEPDDEVRGTVARTLRGEGHDVVAPSSDAETLEWCKKNRAPDLLVMDLRPNSLRMAELLCAIRGRAGRAMPTLFVSRTPRRVSRFGSVGPILFAPFDPLRVLAAVDEVVLESEVRRTTARRPVRERHRHRIGGGR
jgi:CheY-like chemotaxis protein